MKKKTTTVLSLMIAPLFLGGCTLLPASFQVASLALDGISLMTTQKSLTDHGLSAVAQQDCALWRGVTGEGICQDVLDPSATAQKDLNDLKQPEIEGLYLSVI